MSERKVYHVMPGSEDRWQVKGDGALRASSVHERKGEALVRARALAKAQTPSQVVVHKRDGTIQREYTYGEDPHPPAG